MNSTTDLYTKHFSLTSEGALVSFWARTDFYQNGQEGTFLVSLLGDKGTMLIGNITEFSKLWTRYDFPVTNSTVQTVGTYATLQIHYDNSVIGKVVAIDNLIIVKGSKLCFTGITIAVFIY